MGNLLSTQSTRNDSSLHTCDVCGYWTPYKQRMQAHLAEPCTGTQDKRFKRSSRNAISSSADSTPLDEAAAEAAQLRAAIAQELGQHMEESGEPVPPEMLADLAGAIADVISNGEE